MGRNCANFPGYGSKYLSRMDLNPSMFLYLRGFRLSQKEIDRVYKDARAGYVVTGSFDGRWARRTPIYDVDLIIDMVKSLRTLVVEI